MKRSNHCTVRILLMSACAISLLAGGATAADEMSFRDLTRKYFKDGDGQGLAKLVGFQGNAEIKQVIGLEYKVLLFVDGKEQVVDPKTHQFNVGDQIRVSVEPLDAYYIYIFHTGASGENSFLLPADDEKAPLTKARQALALPDDGYFEVTEPPGEESLIVVAAEKPVEDLDMLQRVLAKKPGEKFTPEEQAVKDTLKATRKKVLTTVSEQREQMRKKMVMWRGLPTKEEHEKLAEDVRARGVTEGTFEEPGKEGVSTVYISTTPQKDPKLLVHIPLKSVPTGR